MEILCGNDTVYLLSGTGAGYVGTAPGVTLNILVALGVPEDQARRVEGHSNLIYHFQENMFHHVEQAW